MGLSEIIRRVATYRVSLWSQEPSEEDLRREIAAASAAADLAKDGIEPLPESVAKLMGTLRNPNFKVRDAISALEADPGLASDVVRIANSAALGGRGACDSVGAAFMRLGAAAVADLVVAAHIEALGTRTTGYSRLAFQHSVRVARIARCLPSVASASPERLFLCGLLHDIGVTLLDQSGEFTYYMDLYDDDRAQCDAEVAKLGYDHAMLAGIISKLWGLPDTVGRLVQAHHHPIERVTELGSDAPAAASLMLAEAIAHRIGDDGTFGAEEAEAIAQLDCARMLSLNADALKYLWDERIRGALAEGGESLAA